MPAVEAEDWMPRFFVDESCFPRLLDEIDFADPKRFFPPLDQSLT